MIDTAPQLLASLLFSLLLLMAALHKFSKPLQFRGILAAYRLLPAALIPIAAFMIPLLELSLALSWLLPGTLPLAAIGTALLLGAYGSAMAINIWRGNTAIDCGCNLAGSKDESRHYLSLGLVLRNGLLAAIAALAVVPANGRALGVLDYVSVALACLVIALLYAAANQLIANRHWIKLGNPTAGGEHA